ncbi:MAG: AmmeMemoRadiSam system protein B [Dissulfuribacterales bacterium]
MIRTSIMVLVVALFCVWTMECSCAASDEAGHTVRPAAVAGRFYPDDTEDLHKTVRPLLRDASGVDVKETIRGLVSPHAGYIYSGIVAAAGYRQISPSIRTVILIGPSHRFPLKGPSIDLVSAYQTPLAAARHRLVPRASPAKRTANRRPSRGPIQTVRCLSDVFEAKAMAMLRPIPWLAPVMSTGC